MGTEAERGVRPHPYLIKVATGEWDPAAFRDHLHRVGTPLVEPLRSGEVAVTFVDEPGPETDEVLLRPLIGFNTLHLALEPVAETPFRAITLPMSSRLRFGYGFERRSGDDTTLLPDPFNPPTSTDERMATSVAALPDSPGLEWLEAAGAQPDPQVETTQFSSEVLQNTRRIWVSLPPTELADERPLPLVLVFDGTPGHWAPRLRDALLRAGRIRPCAVALVDQIGIRAEELTCNPDFSRMLVTELLPWLRERHPLSADRDDVVLSGSSFGGLCAGWTALHHPDAFGAAILQSPSCWYHPDRDGVTDPDLLRRSEMITPKLIADFVDRDPVPVRIFHECGILEDGPPPAQLRHVFGHRWLRDVLTLKGYDVEYREFPGGHDALWWRGTWAQALQWALPAPGALA